MRTIKNQSGATLITSLIMLVVLTLLVVSSIRSSNTNLRIAGNMQMQEEAATAAQQAIEQVLSSNFTTTPAAATVTIDIDNNGTVDYTSQIETPVCNSTKLLASAELNPLSANDKDCIASNQVTNPPIEGPSGVTPSTTAWCLKQSWDIKSTVIDSKTGASTVVHQGAFLRVKTGTPCPG